MRYETMQTLIVLYFVRHEPNASSIFAPSRTAL